MISNVITVKLKKLLEERSKSIFQLHKETAITYPTLHKIASGKGEGISFKVLEKLCENLGCFPSDLLLYERNTTPQTVKPQKVKVAPEKPASKPETPKKMASAKGMTTEQVAKRLEPLAGKILSPRRILDYVKLGKLKSEQSGKRTARVFSEADYLEFETWYRKSKNF
jgi:DNA-binding Xre family transcriptional regulator